MPPYQVVLLVAAVLAAFALALLALFFVVSSVNPARGDPERSDNHSSFVRAAYSYHIYNLTSFTQRFVVRFYCACHNFMRYNVPITVDEFSCWEKEADWNLSLQAFRSLGCSCFVWTYKANRFYYLKNPGKELPYRLWGFYECDQRPADIDKASFKEIEEAYQSTKTECCQKTMIYQIFKKDTQAEKE